MSLLRATAPESCRTCYRFAFSTYAAGRGVSRQPDILPLVASRPPNSRQALSRTLTEDYAMEPINRRTAIKGGFFVAAAYPIVPTALFAPDAAAHPTPEEKLYVQGSPNFFGVSVSIYKPDVERKLPTGAARTPASSNDLEILIGGLLSVSSQNGDGTPENGTDDERIMAKSSRILDQPIVGDRTTRHLLSTSSKLFWMRQSPAVLIAIAIGGSVVVVRSLTGGFFDEFGRLLARDVYPEVKGWFLEVFD